MFEDETCIRLIHFQQLSGTDVLLLKGRFEVSGYGLGSIKQISDKDINTDLRTRSLGCFMERKLNGKRYYSIPHPPLDMVLNISYEFRNHGSTSGIQSH